MRYQFHPPDEQASKNLAIHCVSERCSYIDGYINCNSFTLYCTFSFYCLTQVQCSISQYHNLKGTNHLMSKPTFRNLAYKWKIHWRRDRLPIPVFLGFPCGSAGKESACNVGDLGSTPGLGRSPGEGKGYPLQYSGQENSMGCTVHGVTKSRTWLRDFHIFFMCAKEACPSVVSEVPIVIKDWKQYMFPLIRKWLNKLWNTHRLESCIAIITRSINLHW